MDTQWDALLWTARDLFMRSAELIRMVVEEIFHPGSTEHAEARACICENHIEDIRWEAKVGSAYETSHEERTVRADTGALVLARRRHGYTVTAIFERRIRGAFLATVDLAEGLVKAAWAVL